MSETPTELVHQIQTARSHLDDDLTALQRRVKQQVARQLHVWNHPIFILGAGVVAGIFLLGFLAGRLTHSKPARFWN